MIFSLNVYQAFFLLGERNSASIPKKGEEGCLIADYNNATSAMSIHYEMNSLVEQSEVCGLQNQCKIIID